jgi:hypothetical protein
MRVVVSRWQTFADGTREVEVETTGDSHLKPPRMFWPRSFSNARSLSIPVLPRPPAEPVGSPGCVTPRWREMDSNFQSPVAKKRVPFGE